MVNEEVIERSRRVIIHSLAHHNPEREDFGDHVFYLFNHALCIGCFSFLFGTIIGLILSNTFFTFIVNFIDFSFIMTFFIFCWIASIFQYSFQILKKRPVKNRIIKFSTRFIFSIGGIILIFKSPLLGFACILIAGYLIIYIRKIKERVLKTYNVNRQIIID
jgi:hypothetical protein